MILVALGANLPSSVGSPRATCEAALTMLEAAGVRVVRRSRWYRSAPVPASDQPWFLNGIAAVATRLAPAPLLATLHGVEERLGRVRSVANAARVIDLDLIAHGDLVGGPPGPHVPHPRLQDRAFVLLPLRDVAPGWRHPVTGASVEAMIASLPPDQIAEPMDGS